MTAQEAAQGKPEAAEASVGFYRFGGILRTTGVKSAVLSQPWAEQVTVSANDGDQDFLHCFSTFSHNV
jgi:hypothetical protein